jgi:hypothetical protein
MIQRGMYEYELEADDLITCQPRFLAYCKAKKLAIGDRWKTYEYINWINEKASEFKKIHGLGRFDPLSKLGNDGQERFTEWLMKEAER